MANACSIRVRGVVQGVGFRPFVYRLAQCEHAVGLGAERRQGVEIHLEGEDQEWRPLSARCRASRRRRPASRM